jgi:uncharacterized protein YjbJ (UPF0337 family)
MDKNRITGAAKRAKGAIKERIGRLTRNARLSALAEVMRNVRR